MSVSKIEWTDATWNPVRGCTRVSEGCRNCYAERQSARFWPQYAQHTPSGPRWTGRVDLIESKLTEPLRWRKPRRVFVDSMSDLFHESLSDAAIDRVFAVMALASRHIFQVLTKRPERLRAWSSRRDSRFMVEKAARIIHAALYGRPLSGFTGCNAPIPNAWLGVSVEDQATADERIPILLDTPAAVRFVSYEPALGPVDLRGYMEPSYHDGCLIPMGQVPGLSWCIVGGESGPSARLFDVEWARSIVEQCKVTGVPCFVKQLGAKPYHGGSRWYLADPKGGDPAEWPVDLRVRQWPE